MTTTGVNSTIWACAARLSVAISLCWPLSPGNGNQAAAAEIVLKPRVASRGSVVLLGDVAAVTGSPAEADALEELARLELFPAPSRGKTRLLRRRELRELLVLHGIDAAAHRIQGAASTRIHPPSPGSVPRASALPAEPRPAPSVVAIATRSLPRGALLVDGDIRYQRAPVEGQTAGGPAVEGPPLAGLELLRPVAAGEIVDPRYLRRPLLIRRGDMVTVVARSTGVHVRTTARAVDDGAIGDLVTLQALENRERYVARVTGHQAAEVHAGGVRVSERTARPRTTERSALPPIVIPETLP